MLVKICGITNVDDARYALKAGADWIGLNLVAGPRKIDLAAAEQIVTQLDDPSRAVALVQASNGRVADELLAKFRSMGLRRLQLYGDRIPEAVRFLANEGFESIVVQPVANEASLASLDGLLAACGNNRPDYVVFDAAAPGQLGGTGRQANWEVIAAARANGRYADWPPVLLAGGLTPGNVSEAIRKLAPAGVDVSSGVESALRQKNHVMIDAFVTAARHQSEDRPG